VLVIVLLLVLGFVLLIAITITITSKRANGANQAHRFSDRTIPQSALRNAARQLR
jgi:hypothetical protein